MFKKVNWYYFYFSLLLLTGCSQPSPEPFKWEYTIQTINDDAFKESMNTLGKDGWEMVFARRASDGASYGAKFSYEVIFKRVKIEKEK